MHDLTKPVPLDARLTAKWRIRYHPNLHSQVEYDLISYVGITARVTTSKRGVEVWGPSAGLQHITPIQDLELLLDAQARILELLVWLRDGDACREVGKTPADLVQYLLLR